jgi:hypothetical protein
MFSFRRRSSDRSHELPATIRIALENDGVSPAVHPSGLRMLEQRGSYSGRSVSFFRVFDAARAAERGVHPSSFADLDAHPDLVLGSGHIEHGGAVALTTRAKREASQAPTRERADRRSHSDDERVVFPETRSE